MAAVLVVTVLTIPFDIAPYGQRPDTRGIIYLVVMGVAALGLVLGYRYLVARKRAQLELVGGEQNRRLAEEYQRLADIAITAQEHTDLKLGDLSAQLDYLREQNGSQKVPDEVK